MNLKSKFQQKSDDFSKKNSSSFESYLNLKEYKLEAFKFEKENKSYLFDILPYKIETENHPSGKKGDLDYHLEVYTHNIQLSKTEFYSFLCMEKMYGKTCECCNEFVRLKEKLENDGLSNDEVWNEIKHLAYKQRIIYHIKYENKNYIFDVSYKLFEKKWKDLIDNKKKRGKDVFPIYLNEEGCTSIEFSYEQKGQFYELISFDFPEIEDYNEKYVKDLVSLEKLLVIPDQQTIKNRLSGEVENSNVDENDNKYYDEVIKPTVEEPKEEVQKKKKTKVDTNYCPYEFVFGQDYDTYENCDKCVNTNPENYQNCKNKYKEENQ